MRETLKSNLNIKEESAGFSSFNMEKSVNNAIILYSVKWGFVTPVKS
jgi:hypothetical protein